MAPELKKNAAQVAVIGAVALLSRQIYLDQMGQDPLFDVVVGSAESYVDLAQQKLPWAVHTEETPASLYALFLHSVFRLFGEDLAQVRDLQTVIGALNCLLLWSLARSLVSHRVALITGLACALYGPFIYFDGALQPTVLAIFFSLLALRVAVSALTQQPRGWRFWVAGVLFGCATLSGAHLLLFAPIAAWWMWRYARLRDGATSMLLGFVAVALLGMWSHGWRWPLQDVSVSAAGLYDFWRGHEVLVEDPYYASRYSSLLAALMWVWGLAFPFGIVGPLALVGVGSRLRDPRLRDPRLRDPRLRDPRLRDPRLRDPARSPAETFLLLFVGTTGVTAMFFEADAAGRAVIVPILLLIAAAGVSTWLGANRKERRLSLSAFLVLFIGLNFYQGAPSVVAEQHHWRGEAYARRGMTINTQSEYESAVRHGSDRIDSYLSLATVYSKGNDSDRAVAVYEKLLRRWPNHTGAVKDLAAAYMASERFVEAVETYEELTAIDADFALPRLAQARLLTKDRPGAIRAYEKLLTRQPENGEVRYLAALLYIQEERRADAAEAYLRLLADPEWSEQAGLRLARLHVEAGRPTEAESLLRNILSGVNPDSELALAHLGRLLYERRQFEEALVYLERLRRLQTEVHQTYFYLSAIYREQGRHAEAEEIMKLYERYRLERRRADMEQRMEEESNLMLRKTMEMAP